MHNYNLITIAFIIALVMVSVWWAFNAVRQIELQKSFSADALTSIAKLWRRASFIPEDAKERESLYLYRDFLRKFHESDCKYPIMVKNGGVRCMTRKEYDNLCGQKSQRPFSLLIVLASVLVAFFTMIINIYVTKSVAVGIGLALILPAVQGILYFYVARFNREKNAYRDGIFQALKENSVAFLSVTKPFIIVDAYPDRFGKDAEPLYATKGELTDEQVQATREFIVRQKSAETEVVLRNVDNRNEIEQITNPKPIAPKAPVAAEPVPAAATPEPTPAVTATPAPTPVAPVEPTPAAPAPTPAPATEPTPAPATAAPAEPVETPLTEAEKTNLIENLINDTLKAEVDRAIRKANQAAQMAQGPEAIEDLPPLSNPAPVAEPAAPVTPVTPPAADDFSLDAIEQAIDAEIANRTTKKKR